jgi:hypothetical protein
MRFYTVWANTGRRNPESGHSKLVKLTFNASMLWRLACADVGMSLLY